MKNLFKYLLVLIPIMGFISSIFLIIEGFSNNIKTKICVGFGGIILNILVIYSLANLAYFSDEAMKNRTYSAKKRMKEVEMFVELYKLKYKQYPDSIEQLGEFDATIWCVDPFRLVDLRANSSNLHFNYARKDTSYILFSIGRDRIPNTSDDIYLDKNFVDTVDNKKRYIINPLWCFWQIPF